MTLISVILIIFGLLIGLPVLAYMMVKFGAAGFFRAKEKQQHRDKQNEKQNGQQT